MLNLVTRTLPGLLDATDLTQNEPPEPAQDYEITRENRHRPATHRVAVHQGPLQNNQAESLRQLVEADPEVVVTTADKLEVFSAALPQFQAGIEADILAYLTGVMSPEDRADFELDLQEEPELFRFTLEMGQRLGLESSQIDYGSLDFETALTRLKANPHLNDDFLFTAFSDVYKDRLPALLQWRLMVTTSAAQSRAPNRGDLMAVANALTETQR